MWLLIVLCLLGRGASTAAPSQSPTTMSPTSPQPTISSIQEARKMHYISWTETFNEAAASWDADSLGAEEIFGAANADDLSSRVRFGETGLRGRFPFLGRDRYEMLVNSNGWIGFDDMNTLPCQYIYRYIQGHPDTFPIYACFQTGYSRGADSTTLNTTYYGGIGVYLTDLYPTYNYPTANIKWSNTSEGDGIIVHWIKTPFFDERIRKKSQITAHSRLRGDGQISIYWDALNFTRSECEEFQVCVTNNMIAGIRDSVRSEQGSFLATTTAQDHIAHSTWNTYVKGVYPANGLSDMQTGKIFHMCPISDSWTLSPNYAKQGSSSAMNVTFYAMYTSCDAQFASYKCSFTRVGGSATAHTSTAHYYKGNYTAVWSPYYPSYICEVPSAVISAEVGSYAVDLLGVFSSAVQSDAGSVTELSLLPESDIASESFTLRLEQNNRSLDANNDCAVSDAMATSVGHGGACLKCSMKWNVTTCMFKHTTCPRSMLAPADCRGQCPSEYGAVGVPYLYDTVTLMGYDWDDRSFTYKHTANCCNSSVIDCAGECNGGRHIAPTMTAEAYAMDGSALYDNRCCSPVMLTPDRSRCCLNSAPDCAGSCGGNATVDCLGHCQKWYSNGTWNDCAGICGGNSFENACGDCYNETYAGSVPGLNDRDICRAVLSVTNPDPFLDITAADRKTLEAMVHLNSSEFQQQMDSVYFLTKIGLSYAERGEQSALTITIPIKNERPFALNVSLKQEYDQYRIKYPTLSYPADMILPINSTTTIEVTIDATNVYNRPVKMTSSSSAKTLWSIKPLTIESRPMLHDGMIATRNIENYTFVIFPLTTDCDSISTFDECGYAPKCIYCSTSDPGRSLREVSEEEQQQKRSLYLAYTTSVRPISKPKAHLGGFCTNGFLQERCDTLLLGSGRGNISQEAMRWWMPSFFLIVLAFVGILKWISGLDDSKIWS